MTRKPKGREPAPLIYPDSVRPPRGTLPDAHAIMAMDMRLSAQEITAIRMASAWVARAHKLYRVKPRYSICNRPCSRVWRRKAVGDTVGT